MKSEKKQNASKGGGVMTCHYKRPDLCESTPICCIACASRKNQVIEFPVHRVVKRKRLMAVILAFFKAAWSHLKREYSR